MTNLPNKKGNTPNRRLSKLETAKNWLSEHYEIRYNVITNQLECRELKNQKWEICNAEEIYLQLEHNDIVCSLGNVKAILRSKYPKEYNPFTEYFNGLPKYDFSKGSTIDKIAKYLPLDENDVERFMLQFKKWLIRVIRTAIDENYTNKQILTLIGEEQNTGKTTFLEWLCTETLRLYYKPNISLNKDGKIALAENLIIALDELASISKNQLNFLKSFISTSIIKERLPYGERAITLFRRASFVASTNETDFLHDATGSVRWLCFHIKGKLDFNYKKDIDINEVYSEAYSLLKSGKFDYEFTRIDQLENEKYNRQFYKQTLEMDFVQMHLLPGENESDFKTPREIVEIIAPTIESRLNLDERNIGKALQLLGFKQTSKYIAKYKQTRKGYLVKLNFDSPKNILS